MTQPSTRSSLQGRVVLLNVRFSSGEQMKRRPAIIVSIDRYHAEHADTVIVPLTTNVSALRFGDYRLADWEAAGLPKPSAAKAFLQTVERATIQRHVGQASNADMQAILANLRVILGL